MKLPVDGKVTQDFYTPVDYFSGSEARKTHEALDIVTDGPKPIYAPFSGKVVSIIDRWTENQTRGFGNQVYIEKEYKGKIYTARFAHCHKETITQAVELGQKVSEEQVLGLTGRTGARVPLNIWHTHYELMIDGVRVDPMDENNYPKSEAKYIRMLEKNREVVYLVRNENRPRELWVLNHKTKTRRRVRSKHAWQVMSAFINTRGVTPDQLEGRNEGEGFKDEGYFKPNLLAQMKPQLFKQVEE